MTTPRDEKAPPAVHRRLFGWLPEGRPLPEIVWQQRHRWIVTFALVQAVALTALGFVRGFSAVALVGDLGMMVVPALAARSTYASRRVRMLSATLSLMLSAAIFVDFAGGMTEAHFYFFVMVGVVALYQDWSAFGLCIVMTVLHHAVMGTIDPHDVYGSAVEWRKPILWALIHGAFVLAVSVTHLVAWRASEDQDLADPLTQLPNRAAFNAALARAMHSPTGDVSVLFVDLDNFKRVNDQLGHLVGDHVLEVAAQRMRATLRDTDMVARLGGDEFAIVVDGGEGIASGAAARVNHVLQPPVIVDGKEVFVRASIGVAGSDSVGSRDPMDVVRSADLAMYLAKSAGKNQVTVYDATVDEAVRSRRELRRDLRAAIETGQLDVHYQPVLRSGDEALIGVEALARWPHPVRGHIPPPEFIGLAEETGDIGALGAWVLKTAVAQVAAWQSTIPGCPALQLAVNVSPLQLDDEHFVEMVLKTLDAVGLPPHQLTLEITESLLVSDGAGVNSHLNELRGHGVRIAIDDFGTGYSSLSYLAHLPADIVKIDRSFVKDLHPDTGAYVLVKSIIDLARSFGLDIVAEGVEDACQAELLGQLGCPKLQGYLYAPPLARESFASYMAETVAHTQAA